MHTTLIQRYENGCLMLMDHRDDGYHFVGTAFIVHSGGYLLTAAHLLNELTNPVLVRAGQPGKFTSLSREDATPHTFTCVQKDVAHDIALLKMDIPEEIESPPHIIGNTETLEEGTFLFTAGVSFGHLRIHNVLVMRAMLSAKLMTPNDTEILLFDTTLHPGDAGGPIININDGRIVGVMQGVFDPLQIQQLDTPEGYHIPSNFSYAVAIDYAKPLFEKEGILDKSIIDA